MADQPTWSCRLFARVIAWAGRKPGLAHGIFGPVEVRAASVTGMLKRLAEVAGSNMHNRPGSLPWHVEDGVIRRHRLMELF